MLDALQAWEKRMVDPETYWSKVPKDVLPRLHFYNVSVRQRGSWAGSATAQAPWWLLGDQPHAVELRTMNP